MPEIPVERIAIGAPLLAVGPTGMGGVKVGDPESEAFGTSSELSVWTSADGRRWIAADPGGFERAGYLYDVESTEFGRVVAGEYAVDSHTVVPAIYWSADGASWRRVARGDGWGAARSVSPGDGDLLVVGSDGGFPTVWHSTDGITWMSAPLSAVGHGGEATAGAWVSVGSGWWSAPG